jgi:hypothetical protein
MPVGLATIEAAYHNNRFGAFTYVREVETVAGTSQYAIVAQGMERACRVIGFRGVMTGAGAASDTVRLYAVARLTGTATAITEAIDLSALSENDYFSCATLNETARKIMVGDSLRVDTASGALCTVCVELCPHQETT